MMAQLRKQQQDEYNKWEFCQKEIDITEDDIKMAEDTKEDLDNKHKELSNTIETITRNINMLKKSVAEMEVALKQAGEQRHDENALFQTSVMDQRATINILQKALTRLNQFYLKNATFVEVDEAQSPAAFKEKPADYERSKKSGGVLQLLHDVIKDAQEEEIVMSMGEQKQQADYAKFVKMTTESIEAARASIQEKAAQVASNSAELSETEEA